MGDTNRSLGVEGAGYPATLGEEEYTFMPLTQRMEGEFESWVWKRAKETAIETELDLRGRARQLRGQLSNLFESTPEKERGSDFLEKQRELQFQIRDLEDMAERQLTALNLQKTAGDYHFHGPLCREALSGPEGTAKIVELMLRPKHPDVTYGKAMRLILDYWGKVQDAIQEAQNLGKLKPPPSSKPPADSATSAAETTPSS